MEENKTSGMLLGEMRPEPDYQKKEKKHGINLVDIVLILLLLGFVTVVFYFFAPDSVFSWGADRQVVLEYTVEIPAVPKNMATRITSGDSVFENRVQYSIGTVINTEIDDYVEYVYNKASGKMEAVSYSREGDDDVVLKNILVTITARADYAKGHGYTVNGYRVAINKEMDLRFPGFTGTGQCISMTVKETEGNV